MRHSCFESDRHFRCLEQRFVGAKQRNSSFLASHLDDRDLLTKLFCTYSHWLNWLTCGARHAYSRIFSSPNSCFCSEKRHAKTDTITLLTTKIQLGWKNETYEASPFIFSFSLSLRIPPTRSHHSDYASAFFPLTKWMMWKNPHVIRCKGVFFWIANSNNMSRNYEERGLRGKE